MSIIVQYLRSVRVDLRCGTIQRSTVVVYKTVPSTSKRIELRPILSYRSL